jgi:hypothetical protein
MVAHELSAHFLIRVSNVVPNPVGGGMTQNLKQTLAGRATRGDASRAGNRHADVYSQPWSFAFLPTPVARSVVAAVERFAETIKSRHIDEFGSMVRAQTDTRLL